MGEHVSTKITGADIEKIIDPRTAQRAGQFVGEEIVANLSPYPPATSANRPPAPYYVRGEGTINAQGQSDGSSQKMSSRWNVVAGSRTTKVINDADYSGYAVGVNQPDYMARKGWPSEEDYLNDPRELQKLAEIYNDVLIEAV